MLRHFQKKVSEDKVHTMHSNRKQNSGARIEGAFSAAMHKAEQDKVKQFSKTEYYTLTQQKNTYI